VADVLPGFTNLMWLFRRQRNDSISIAEDASIDLQTTDITQEHRNYLFSELQISFLHDARISISKCMQSAKKYLELVEIAIKDEEFDFDCLSDDNEVSLWRYLHIAAQAIQAKPNQSENHKEVSEAIQLIKVVIRLSLKLQRASPDNIMLAEILAQIESFFQSLIFGKVWKNSFLGGINLVSFKAPENLKQYFEDIIRDLIELMPIILLDNQARALLPLVSLLGMLIFSEIGTFSLFVCSIGGIDTLYEVMNRVNSPSSEAYIYYVVTCHILNCLCAVSAQIEQHHVSSLIKCVKRLVSLKSIMEWKIFCLEIDEKTFPSTLVSKSIPDLSVLQGANPKFIPCVIAKRREDPEFLFENFETWEQIITVNFVALSMSYHESLFILRTLNQIYFRENIVSHAELCFGYILNSLFDRFPLLVADDMNHPESKSCWKWAVRTATDQRKNETVTGFAYLVCIKAIYQLPEICNIFVQHLVENVDFKDTEVSSHNYLGLIIYTLTIHGSRITSDSGLKILKLLENAFSGSNSMANPSDFHTFISCIVPLFKADTSAIISELVDILVKNSEKSFCFSVLDEFVRYTMDRDVLEMFLDQYLKFIGDEELDDDSAVLFIRNGAKFFAQKNMSTQFVTVIVEKEVLGRLLDEMEKLCNQKRNSRISAIAFTLGSMLYCDPFLCEEFVHVGGYDRIFDMFLLIENSISFLEYYYPILMTNMNGIEYLHHSAGIDYLFVKKHEISMDDFKKVYSKIITICTSTNFWNLNICRNAKLTKNILNSLEFLLDCNMLEDSAELLKRLLIFHCDFDDIKTLFNNLKPMNSNSALSWHHDLILGVLIDVASVESVNIPRDFFLISSVQSEFVIPPIASSFFNGSMGYSVFISANFHAITENARDLHLFQLSWNGYCLSLVLNCGILELRTTDATSNQTVTILSNKLAIYKLYSIIFTHQIGMFNLSQELFYLDGERIWKGSVAHPFVDSDLTLQIGRAGTNDYPFPSYIAAAALFNCPISLELIQSLHYSSEVSLPISPVLYQFQMLSIEQQPILFLHPLGVNHVRSKSCFNISGAKGAIESIKLRKIIAANTRSLLDAMQSFGGFELLYPLMNHACLPSNLQHNGKRCAYTLEPPERIASVLRFYTKVISQSHFHRSSYIKTKGSKLISLFLQQMPSECLTSNLLDIIYELRATSNSYPALIEMLESHIIFEPQIWSRSSSDVQKAYFKKMKDKYNDPSGKTLLSLSYWLDCTEQFFINLTEAHSWEFIDFLASKSNSSNDIIRFTESLWCCINSPHGISLYVIFGNLYFSNIDFFNSILQNGGSSLIFRLLESIHEKVRICALETLEKVLNDSQANEKLKEEISYTSSTEWFELLSRFNLSVEIYQRIFHIGVEVPYEGYLGGCVPRKINASTFIKYPELITVLLEILQKDDSIDEEFSFLMLKDIKILVSVNTLNPKLIIRNRGAYHLTSYLKKINSREKGSARKSNELVQLVLEILAETSTITERFESKLYLSSHSIVANIILMFSQNEAQKLLMIYFSYLIKKISLNLNGNLDFRVM
jgi:hypothetical protein